MARLSLAAQDGALRAQARLALTRVDRHDKLVTRLQPFLNMVVDHLSAEKVAAMRAGERWRVDRLDREIDAVYCEFDKIAQGEPP